MSDFLIFNEGKDWLLENALDGTTIHFLLSNQVIGTGLTNTDTLAGGIGEITGTGYARTTQACPAPSGGIIDFTELSWATGAATDWPASVTAIIAVTSADNTGKALWAQHLQTGGAGYDMSAASTTLNVTPTVFLQNVGGG